MANTSFIMDALNSLTTYIAPIKEKILSEALPIAIKIAPLYQKAVSFTTKAAQFCTTPTGIAAVLTILGISSIALGVRSEKKISIVSFVILGTLFIGSAGILIGATGSFLPLIL